MHHHRGAGIPRTRKSNAPISRLLRTHRWEILEPLDPAEMDLGHLVKAFGHPGNGPCHVMGDGGVVNENQNLHGVGSGLISPVFGVQMDGNTYLRGKSTLPRSAITN